MRIRALQTFTVSLPDQMVVLNAAKGKEKAGEADIPDDLAQAYVDAGIAEAVEAAPKKAAPKKAAQDPLDHDGDGRKGGAHPPVDAPADNGAQEDAAP